MDNPISLVQYALQKHVDLVVIQMGDGARAEAARVHLSEAQYREDHDHAMRMLNMLVFLLTEHLKGEPADILIVAPRPPAADAHHPDNWNHLTPIIGYGPDFPPGMFTSATTRTPGLIANIDVAPTLLSLYHLPIPRTMIGRPLSISAIVSRAKSASDRLAYLSRLDFLATLNAAALAPVLVALAALTLLFALGGLLALKTEFRTGASLGAMGVISLMNFPAALLLAPLLVPPTLIEYGLRIGAWMVALTLVTWGLPASSVSRLPSRHAS